MRLRYSIGLCTVCCLLGNVYGQSSYDKLLIKSRADRFEDQGGKSDSGDLYIYADDKKISEDLNKTRKGNERFTAPVNIVVPKIGKSDHVRNVNIVIESKKGITVNTAGVGGKEPEVNIGRADIEKGASVKKVNVLIDSQRGISVK